MATFWVISCVILYISSDVNAECQLMCENVDDDLQDVVEAMSDLGYSVSMGHFEIYDGVTSNTYIPFARSDTDYLVSQFDETGNSYIRFGGQDAIVFRGCTPPNVNYFGYRSYSAARITKQNADNTPIEYTVLESSLGDTLNQKVINTESSDDTSFNAPFDRKTNIITTGDEQTWTDIVTSFTNVALLTEMSINLDAINNGILSKLGIGWFKYSQSELEVPRDTLSLIYRIQWNESSECNKDQYLNQSFPFYVFSKDSKKPRCPINRDLRSTKDRYQKCENCKETKYYFDRAISNIIDYVKTEYKYKFISNKPLNDDDGRCKWFGDWWPPNRDDFVYIFKHGFYCILYQKDCMFDNRDTYYSWDGEDHSLGTNDFYLIVGLNHNNYSLSTTNSISLSAVTNPDNGNAFEIIDTVTNYDYQQYDLREVIKRKKHTNTINIDEQHNNYHDRSRFHSHPDAHINDNHHGKQFQNVFAVQIARPNNCLNQSIPSICPTDDVLADNQRFIFFGEATLNPKTKTMPDQDCLIEWRLLTFNTEGTDGGGCK